MQYQAAAVNHCCKSVQTVSVTTVLSFLVTYGHILNFLVQLTS